MNLGPLDTQTYREPAPPEPPPAPDPLSVRIVRWLLKPFVYPEDHYNAGCLTENWMAAFAVVSVIAAFTGIIYGAVLLHVYYSPCVDAEYTWYYYDQPAPDGKGGTAHLQRKICNVYKPGREGEAP